MTPEPTLSSLAEACAKEILSELIVRDIGHNPIPMGPGRSRDYALYPEMPSERLRAIIAKHLQPLAKDREDAAKALEWALSWAETAIERESETGTNMTASKEWYAKHLQTLNRITPKPASSS